MKGSPLRQRSGLALLLALLPLSAGAFEPKGLYVMTRIFGSSIEMDTWFFRGNQFAQSPASDITRFDFAAAERAAPGTTGTYFQDGEKWTFRWAAGRTTTARYQPGKPEGICFYWNAGLFCPVKTFARGQLLDGSYSGSLGGGGVGASRSYRFQRDGTYTLSRTSSVTTSSAETGAYAGQSSQERGRYRIDGNVLTLQPDGGVAVTFTTFPYEPGATPEQPDRFFAGGFMLKRSGPAGGGSASAATGRAPPAPSAPLPAGEMVCPDRLPAGTPTLDCFCTADSTVSGGVWGSDPYTADSKLCRAALHAGAIGAGGGKIVIRTVPGASSYAGSSRNGVTTASWGAYPQGMIIVKP